MNLGRIITLVSLLLVPHLPAQTTGMDLSARAPGEWKTLATTHFNIYYRDGAAERAIRTANCAEDGYVAAANFLGHEPTRVIPIVCLPSGGARHGCPFVHGLRRAPGLKGAARAPQAIMAHPDGSPAEYRRTLAHSIVHYFQLSVLANGGNTVPKLSALRVPLWIAEGMADYIAGGYDSRSRVVMKDLAARGRFPGIRRLTEGGPPVSPTGGSAGRSFFAFIEQRYGRVAFGEMIREFRDLGFLDDVIGAVTGKSVEELDAEWAAFLGNSRGGNGYQPRPEALSPAIAREETAQIDLVPAVSPDGNRIAYIADRDGFPVLKVVGAGSAGNGGTARTLIDTGLFFNFGRFDTSGNSAAWSPDATRIVLAGATGRGQCLLFADAATGRILSKVSLPFLSILYPSMSRDGRFVVFTGVASSSEDLYLYSVSDGALKRITDDAFSDRYPVLGPDARSVVFSSTWNGAGDVYAATYALYRIDLKTGTRVSLAAEGVENQIQPDISPDGKRLLYAGEQNGAYAVWMYGFDTGKHAPLAGGALHPRWFPCGKKYAYTVRRGSGFELRVNEIGAGGPMAERAPAAPGKKPAHAAAYVNPGSYLFGNASARLQPDHLGMGADVTTGGSSVRMQLTLADILSRHRLVFSANYMRQSKRDDLNASLAYYYSLEDWGLGFSVFRQASPVPAAFLESGANPAFLSGPVADANRSAFYGGALSAGYPFCRFFNLAFRAEAGGYQNRPGDCDMRGGRAAGAGKIAASLGYDALHEGAMVPVRGFIGSLRAEQFVNFTSGGTCTGVTIDMRYYANPARQLVLALHGSGGAIAGSGSGVAEYRLGGYASLRGVDLLGLGGKYMFLFNAEIWLTPGDWRAFGAPLTGPAGNIGLVLFMDAGAAWKGRFALLDRSGRFRDFKMDFGLGVRAAISPILIFKLDFAWPFDRKSLKENQLLFSLDFDY